MVNYTFLLIGIIYTTFLPGFVFTEAFLPKLQFYKKIPLYLLLSALISTYFSYIAALVFGFNRLTLFSCFSLFLILFVVLIFKRRINIDSKVKKNTTLIWVGIVVYLSFFIALYPAIFRSHNGYFVMSGPNWQDTAMHLSIIESLTQGNFPPVAPYFSGQSLSYYYFSDLHAAIINIFYGKFFPQVLILVNPFLAMTFFFAVYALAFSITKRKIISFLTGLMAVMYGNVGFTNLIREIFTHHVSYFSLVKNNPFSSDQTILQMVPLADYFLQNRPMMIGLPAVIIVILLLNNRKFLIAGVVAAALLKFQLFGFITSWIFFGSFILVDMLNRKVSFKLLIKNGVAFLTPTLLFGLILASSKVGDRSFIKVFLDTFSWEPWQKNSPVWFLNFIIQNLNIGIFLFFFALLFKKVRANIKLQPIFITAMAVLVIPFVMRFTIYQFDMFKFFYYLIPFICVVVAAFYSNFKHKRLALIALGLVVLVTSLTSVNVLVHSYLNKTQGYSSGDYTAGIWIRTNAPEKSVFVTMPTVHSAPTDIAGRLRVISYINWPYSHGFNSGEDNVFSRVEDVEEVYKTGDASKVRVKYKAKYIFYGSEERSIFPDAGKLFNSNLNLIKIYDSEGVQIYEIL